MKIGIIGDDATVKTFLKSFSQQIIKTVYGNVLVFTSKKIVFIPRFGKNRNIPPHKVNYKANICAMNLLGVDRLLFLSTASLCKMKKTAPELFLPSDFIDFSKQSFMEFETRIDLVGFDKNLIKVISSQAKKVKVRTNVRSIFFQLPYSRIPTIAEIAYIAQFADIFGHCVATELTLSFELGIKAAAILANAKSKKMTTARLYSIASQSAKQVQKVK